MRDSEKSERGLIVAAFAALYVLWGSTYLGIHYLLAGGFPPFLGAGIRMAVAGALLRGYLHLRGVAAPSRRELAEIAVAGVFLFVGGNGLVMVAQQTLPSGLAATLIATTPFWMAGLDSLLPRGERPSLGAAAGIVVGFAGVALLVGPRLAEGGGSLAGVVLLLLAPLLWSIGGLWARHRVRGVAPLAVTAHEMLAGAVGLGLAGLVRGEVHAFVPTPRGLAALAYLVVFGSLLGFSAFTYLMAKVPVARVATYSYVNPVIAVFLGWLVAGEPVSGRGLAATAVVVLGVALVTLATRRR